MKSREDTIRRKIKQGKIRRDWNAKAFDFFVGKKIILARYLTEKEMVNAFGEEKYGCDKVPLALIFDDGSFAFPMMDDEGNDGGALATSSKEEPVMPVLSRGD